MSRESQTVTLQGMRFHARIGVLAHEAEIAQSIEIDVSVAVESGPTRGGEVVDYRHLYDIAARVVHRGHIRYLEEVARSIASGALEHAAVLSARVAVRKPHVALPGPLAYAEVVVERSREA